MDRQKVLIDTDIGDDIDDALAIALGLRLENVDIVGVTTVFRDTCARARIARHLLSLAGREDIPVYAGSQNGLVRRNDKSPLCQMTPEIDTPDWDAVNAAQAQADDGESAVDYILDTAAKYGEDLIILGIGPLTNLAKAVQKAPDVMNGVGKIVIMGGTYFEHHREWNILCDVEAAEVMYSRCEKLYCVGFDVTNLTTVSYMEHQEMMRMTGEPFRDYLAQLITLWSRNVWHSPTLHDALAMYYIFDPSIVQMRQAKIVVATEGEYTRGMTVNVDGFYEGRTGYRSEGKTHIAFSVDAVRMREVIMDRLFPCE